MNKDKIKKYGTYLLIGITVIISFLCALEINLNTHIYHDEFVYSAIYGTENKIENLLDILKSTFNVYMAHNGRAIPMFMTSVFMQLNSIARAIINSLFFALLVFLLIKFSNKTSNNFKVGISLLIFPLLWCKIPMFGETVIWPAGAINYLWPAVVLLIYIHFIEKVFEKEEPINSKMILIYIFAFIVASLHEMTGIIATGVTGLMFLYLLSKNKKINKNLLICSFTALLGFLFIILSPGSNIRKQAQIATMTLKPTFIENLKNAILMLKGNIIENKFIIAIFIVTFIFVIIKLIQDKKETLKNKEIFEVFAYIVCPILAYIAMSISPTFLKRVEFVPFIIWVYAALKCFNIININKKVKIFEYIFIIIASGVFIFETIPSVKQSYENAKYHYAQWLYRDNEIEKQKKEGKTDIYVEPLDLRADSHLYYGDLSDEITYNHNKSMSVYYDINSIRIKENYYLDIELENVNENNTNSIKVSSASDEKVKTFYLLDKYVYDKMAPYKRFKNSYLGGEITLYFSLNCIEDLSISFLNEQEVTINKIKLYTPNDMIFEVQGEDILHFLDFEQVELINKENGITLKVTENSIIRVFDNDIFTVNSKY